MCANIDDNVCRLMSRLDALKVADNTIVLFLTDNGPQTDRYNAGMRGIKGSVHEGGSRVPLFVRWPANLKTPRRVGEIAAHIDVLPTLLDLCGVPLPKNVALDGLSLRPLLEGNRMNWPDRILFTHQVRQQQLPERFPGALRTQRYRLVNEGGNYQLYDMQTDPGEARDISAENREEVKRLSSIYEQWYKDVAKQGFVRLPIPLGYCEENPVLFPAHQAFLDGNVRFRGRYGFAHDWVTGWTGTEARVAWELDVVRSGWYEVTLSYPVRKPTRGHG